MSSIICASIAKYCKLDDMNSRKALEAEKFKVTVQADLVSDESLFPGSWIVPFCCVFTEWKGVAGVQFSGISFTKVVQ